MYYIINQTHQIIAADSSLLELLSVENIDELYREIALGNIKFSSPLEEEIIITTSKGEEIYHAQNNTLSGILGDITLVQIQTPEEDDNTAPMEELLVIGTAEVDEISTLADSSLLNDEPDTMTLGDHLSTESDEILDFKDEVDEKVEISEEETDEKTIEDENIEEETSDDIIFNNDNEKTDDNDVSDEILDFKNEVDEKVETSEKETDEKIVEDENIEEETSDDIIFNNDNKKTDDLDLISIKDDNDVSDEVFGFKDEVDEKVETSVDDDEPFNLVLPTAPEETIDDISMFKSEIQEVEIEKIETEEDTAPIVIDISNISEEIGISTEDYNHFLDEYIDTALTLEKDLQSDQDEKRSRAISTLSHLSHVLHLPMITKIVTQIEDASLDTQNTHIQSLYDTLGRLTTSPVESNKEETSPEEISFISETDSETKVDTIDFIDEESIPAPEVVDSIDIALQEEEPPSIPEAESVTTSESFGTINLDDVQPIHFDFQLEEAANDLSLPVELIEEFVHDFIGQAHIETEKMLAAYEKGDLDTIQKIGHLLKGTSSNLRINPLSDTLYEIQFCEDSSKLEDLIKNYWAHFLSFETQLNLTSR